MKVNRQRLKKVEHPLFTINVPAEWTRDVWKTVPQGVLAIIAGDGHRVRVQRALDGLVPVESLMATVAFESRLALDGYECSEASGVVVLGAGPARTRMAVTTENDASSYVMAELFATGYDKGMWYIDVGAPRHLFNAELAEQILDSLAIRFGEVAQ